jgi:hypothetical protein
LATRGTTWQIRQVHLDHPVALFKGFQTVVFLVGIVDSVIHLVNLSMFISYKPRDSTDSACLRNLIEVNILSPTIENLAILAICSQLD